jgi:hypothetical protein
VADSDSIASAGLLMAGHVKAQNSLVSEAGTYQRFMGASSWPTIIDMLSRRVA